MRVLRMTLPVAVAVSLVLSGVSPSVAEKIELQKGYRAIALTLDADQAMFVEGGDRIDVMVTFDALMKDDKKEQVTATILQNIVVLEKRPGTGNASKSVLELLLNPNEAQYLALSIDGEHHLRIISRKQGDTEMHPMEMASFRKLFR